MINWGYARVSTAEKQESGLNTQIELLKKNGVGEEHIIVERESGGKIDRKGLKQLLDSVHTGDTIITFSIDRISRSTRQMFEIFDFIETNKLKLIILNNNLVVDCTQKEMDIMTSTLLKVLSIFNEYERKIICSRVQAGVNEARKHKTLGRPKTSYEMIPQIFFFYLPKYRNKEINKSEFSRLTSLSLPTIYKYLKIVG